MLQPGESHMIDLKMLQREGMPGTSGELLPETAKYGGFKLVEEPGGRHFLVDAVVFNPKTATCGVCGFGCLYPTSINMPGGNYIVALADSGDIIAVNAHMCDGTNQTGWACTASFSSDNTGIASNNPTCQSRGTGVSAGGTTFRTVAADVPGPYCGDQTLYSSRPVTVPNCICSCPTPLMSDTEWSALHSDFPNLERCSTCKTAAATTTYNCMAWTLDDTSRWWWFEADANGDGKLSGTELNAFYSTKGKSGIIYYGPSLADVVHVAKGSGGFGVDCQISSKLGSSIRIGHDQTDLQGGVYSNVVGGN